jgi:hypothetical protein
MAPTITAPGPMTTLFPIDGTMSFGTARPLPMVTLWNIRQFSPTLAP